MAIQRYAPISITIEDGKSTAQFAGESVRHDTLILWQAQELLKGKISTGDLIEHGKSTLIKELIYQIELTPAEVTTFSMYCGGNLTPNEWRELCKRLYERARIETYKELKIAVKKFNLD